MKAWFKKYQLRFHRPAGTSRGVMNTRDGWFIFIKNDHSDYIGIGEIAPLPNLSCDDRPDLESKIDEVCRDINNYKFWLCEGLQDFPSVRFGLETALLDLKNGADRVLFPSEFTAGKAGIPINGLIWMGDTKYMQEQLAQKIEQGFRCIKLKIGAIDFDKELQLIAALRKQYDAAAIEIRVDANGAFGVADATGKLQQLARLDVHSIEQPVRQGQWPLMAELCRNSPVPVALDEELIGINAFAKKENLLDTLQPQYIILKPSLHGGMAGCDEWISLANQRNIGWWITSALESNVGLSAIAQYTFRKNVTIPQGLGTGQLFTNNIPSPLEIASGALFYKPENKWDFKTIL
ncbi:MAG: o-succinylbenzoate synthase [Bacteroidales bacterium]|jgi:o-succinylbenzoate synthase|nr:o-succinylbenzoate synthase [Bacteroidales bacterium]MDY0335634.1 o-succinylbenzoate synthase [Bacteroidales bacterium]